ncbi:hypothetical protein PHYSODRAFT_299276 [Phytophthora sojae]|uniref:Uncharacterized protein n=1 Tax=Phytophthora sojae (strain P6497) TaxID=1094619 RepID=G4Z4S9_PHYSP|nr:hypothetical protein PHYSODRAFT_299276 [Phytophthora sojae]EGZ21616.1 hypothetical protein PHYSODRAFT_299276 [Phytophthora sojae]|eukprot:XP_009524333.1 hypothetical protein PHYSODRAFT_299276 [Phytophthora sojae]
MERSALAFAELAGGAVTSCGGGGAPAAGFRCCCSQDASDMTRTLGHSTWGLDTCGSVAGHPATRFPNGAEQSRRKADSTGAQLLLACTEASVALAARGRAFGLNVEQFACHWVGLLHAGLDLDLSIPRSPVIHSLFTHNRSVGGAALVLRSCSCSGKAQGPPARVEVGEVATPRSITGVSIPARRRRDDCLTVATDADLGRRSANLASLSTHRLLHCIALYCIALHCIALGGRVRPRGGNGRGGRADRRGMVSSHEQLQDGGIQTAIRFPLRIKSSSACQKGVVHRDDKKVCDLVVQSLSWGRIQVATCSSFVWQFDQTLWMSLNKLLPRESCVNEVGSSN